MPMQRVSCTVAMDCQPVSYQNFNPKRHSQPQQNPSSNGFIQTGQYNAQNQRLAKNSVGRLVGNYALALSPCRAYSSLLAPEASQLENFQ